MSSIMICCTLQQNDSIFRLDHESEDVVKTIQRTLEIVGKEDILLSKILPDKICIAHEKEFEEDLLARAETIATLLTGMSRDMLEKFGGVNFIRRYPEYDLIWDWNQIKKYSLNNKQ